MNKNLKKIIISVVSLLMLASVGSFTVGNYLANASSYMSRYARRATYVRRSYVRKPIKLERLNHSRSFAYIRPIGHKWLHRNERIGVVPFYHMGHDGYIVHIPGHRGIYYAPTNSRRWFGRRVRSHHYRYY